MSYKPKLVMEHLCADGGEVFRKCPDCGAKMKGTRGKYQYAECGLSSVTLANVLIFRCKCGLRVPEIPAISELHCMIALSLLLKPTLLAGEEVRFLRKVAGLSQAELATIMGVDTTRPSKWENDGIGKEGDRLLRSFCLLGMNRQFEYFRRIDVRKMLSIIRNEKLGPAPVMVENDPNRETERSWFLPVLQEGQNREIMQ